MFNIGVSELVIILLVAFLVVGPKDLPKVARALARALLWIGGIVKQFKKELHWDEIVKEVNDTKKSAKSAILDADVTREIREVKKQIDQVKQSTDIKQTLKDVESDLKNTITVSGIHEDLKNAGNELKTSLGEATAQAKESRNNTKAEMKAQIEDVKKTLDFSDTLQEVRETITDAEEKAV